MRSTMNVERAIANYTTPLNLSSYSVISWGLVALHPSRTNKPINNQHPYLFIKLEFFLVLYGCIYIYRVKKRLMVRRVDDSEPAL